LNVHGVHNGRQTEVRTAEPLVPESIDSEVEMAFENLKRYTSPGIDQIQVEMNKTGGRTIRSEIHKITISVWNEEELPEE
jgi:hypothetical protein